MQRASGTKKETHLLLQWHLLLTSCTRTTWSSAARRVPPPFEERDTLFSILLFFHKRGNMLWPVHITGYLCFGFRQAKWGRCWALESLLDVKTVNTSLWVSKLTKRRVEKNASCPQFNAHQEWRRLENWYNDKKPQGGLFWHSESLLSMYVYNVHPILMPPCAVLVSTINPAALSWARHRTT